ncbi:MAG: hypothetical protein L3I91_02450 [Mycoplasma sp.]
MPLQVYEYELHIKVFLFLVFFKPYSAYCLSKFLNLVHASLKELQKNLKATKINNNPKGHPAKHHKKFSSVVKPTAKPIAEQVKKIKKPK